MAQREVSGSEDPGILPETRHVTRDWPRTLGLVAVGLFLIAAAAYGVQLEPDGHQARRFHQDSFVILPLASLLACVAIWRLVIPLGAPLLIGRTGITDLRMNRAEIPWDAVRHCARKGDFVVLTLKPTFARTYRVPVEQKLVKAAYKRIGPNHLMLATWCLNTTPQELLEIVQRYRGPG